MLDTLIPRLRSGVRLQLRDDGTAVVVDTVRGRFTEIAADEASLAGLVDGHRTIADVVATQFERNGAVSFLALGDLLARLRLVDALENAEAELNDAGIQPGERTNTVAHLLTARLVRVVGPLAVLVTATGGPILLLLCLVALGAALSRGGHRPLDPLLPGGSALAGLVGLIIGAGLALTVRSVLKAFAGLVLGVRPAALELRLYFGLPVFGVEGGQLQLLARNRRIAAHVCALLAPWLVALCAALLASSGQAGPALASVALGAAIVGYLDAIPFALGSFGHALTAFAGRVNLQDHARAYVTRRIAARGHDHATLAGEGMVILTTVLSGVWILGAVRMVSRGGASQLARLAHSVVGSQGAEAPASRIAALILVAAVLAACGAIVWLFFVAVRSAFPDFFRMRVVSGRREEIAPGATVEALARVPIFSTLTPETLGRMAQEFILETFRPGGVIARQGDPGDRFYAVVSGQVEVLRQERSGLQKLVVTLGPGDCFGETALLQTVPRTATIRATGPVQLLSISRAGFERLVKALPGVDLSRTLRATAALHRSALAASLPPQSITEIVPRLLPREVAGGEILFRAGDPGTQFFLIDQGEVEIQTETGARVALLGSGESFGETALLLSTPRTATARATTASSLWALSRVDLYAVLSRNTAFSESLEHRAETRVVPGL